MDPLTASYTTNIIPRTVLTVLAGMVILVFTGCIYAFLRSVVGFIFSHGDTTKQQKAWDGIQYMVIGLILCLVFLFLFPILFKKAKIEGYQYYTPGNVFIRAGELLRELFSLSTIVREGYNGSKIFSQPLDTNGGVIDIQL